MSTPCKVPGCPALAVKKRDLCAVHARLGYVALQHAVRVAFGMVAPVRRVDLGRIEYEKSEDK